MSEQNPFKEIEPEIKLPEKLKEDILQEIKEIVEEQQDNDASTTTSN
ncbi:hypothetical protein C8N46_107134 [Kordia periserrulae]|uniref:Uncharacterized protein n=1 Tax=Kordia periserrulae TaxID=701523 RepID=A0A2T6BVL8_9FLAO|nr:hypothetical protein [Kordia periserrulae]PTX60128.1 hypothetical protein C8N46_107134 [Kordia periserrulae]